MHPSSYRCGRNNGEHLTGFAEVAPADGGESFLASQQTLRHHPRLHLCVARIAASSAARRSVQGCPAGPAPAWRSTMLPACFHGPAQPDHHFAII